MAYKCIDLSSYQGSPDWDKIYKDGIRLAILRITQKYGVDSSFEYNFRNAQAKGIRIGVYKFSYAKSVSEIKTEATGVVNQLSGRGIDLPVFLDLEWDEQRSLSSSTIASMIEAFRAIIIKAGLKFGIYCNTDWWVNVIPSSCKSYDAWLAAYGTNNGTKQSKYKPSATNLVGWQYSSQGTVAGVSGGCDVSEFYTDYSDGSSSSTTTTTVTTDDIVKAVRQSAVDFAVGIANDNSHGYSQAVRSLYNTTNPKSFDCSSLVCTSYYYAFKKHGLDSLAQYLYNNCSYTGNMLKMINCGFEVVATNQTACSKAILGDIELNTTYHTALDIGDGKIVHARSSEGTSDTKDGSGNEIRTQDWYLYSHGWTHRLRFTGKGVDLTSGTAESGSASEVIFEMTFNRELKSGMTGTDVKVLQTMLRGRSCKGADKKVLTLDGELGANTVYAIKAFQKRESLAVDGIAGAKTLAKLFS